MRENPYKQLPPIERKQDGSLYRMTPTQRKQANALIRRECCCYEDGNCMFLDDGDTHTCPQTISFSVCCKWFRRSVLPQIGTLEAEIFRDTELKRCAVCGGVFVPKSNRAKYCPDCAARVHRRQKTESERKRRSCVDIAIIQGIDTDADKQQFLRALIDYAHPRGVQVLAEGVETLSELRKVLEMGVDLLQGYCLAPPAAEPGAIDEKAAEVIAEVERQKAEREEAGS